MARLSRRVMIYDPSVRADRGYEITIEGPELVIDALDREDSLLDLQILAEAAASKKFRWPAGKPA